MMILADKLSCRIQQLECRGCSLFLNSCGWKCAGFLKEPGARVMMIDAVDNGSSLCMGLFNANLGGFHLK